MGKPITITLNTIKRYGLDADGWEEVLKANGGINADFDKPFTVSSILYSNSLGDTLLILRYLPDHNLLWRQFAAWCALRHVDKIKLYYSKDDYELIVNFLTTLDLNLRDSAIAAAREAARVASWDAAGAALWAAGATAEAAELKLQEGKLRQILDAGEWVSVDP